MDSQSDSISAAPLWLGQARSGRQRARRQAAIPLGLRASAWRQCPARLLSIKPRNVARTVKVVVSVRHAGEATAVQRRGAAFVKHVPQTVRQRFCEGSTNFNLLPAVSQIYPTAVARCRVCRLPLRQRSKFPLVWSTSDCRRNATANENLAARPSHDGRALGESGLASRCEGRYTPVALADRAQSAMLL
jgi:hypothetical protein